MSSADLIIQADTVHTMDPCRPAAEAIAADRGVIIGVGSRREIAALRNDDTEVVELGAATITPGWVDGHIHPVLGIGMTRGADLSTVSDVGELVGALRRAACSADEQGGWVLGWGLNPSVFAGAAITSEPLVRALGDTPALIIMFDAHSAIASPCALRAAGIDGPRSFDGGAEIVCDDGGRPTGHLLEIPAYEPVQALVPAESSATRRGKLYELLAGMAAVGITAGNAMDFEGDSAELITVLAQECRLPIRLRFAPFCMPGVSSSDLDQIVAQQRLGGPRWHVDGVKFMIDGTVDGGTAWLSEPDRFGESTAPFWPEPQAYAEALQRLAAAGVPTVTHAIGDQGVRYVLDTLADLPVERARVPHRIEHIETIPGDLVHRFRAQNVTASMQPTHCTLYSRADQTDNWSRRLGAERAGRAWRTRDLRAAGARLALGSDWPIAPYDPRGVLADAQLRRHHGHPETDPILPEQGLTARMALEGYTTHAAAAAGLEHVAGQIREGFRADLSAFGLDPLRAPPDEFAEAPVPLTVVDGTIVHRR
ncbi:MAG TPA: amidohydrolase [Microlunatus sp.]|nr:amidohydrolase [Microlunatus sp.]